MTKNKNQDSKTKQKENNLSDVVRSEMIGKNQVRGILKEGNNFCISGLIINHFAPDINIEHDSWGGITTLVDRYPIYFSQEDYSTSSYYGHDYVQKYINDFKQYYKDTKRINLRILVTINDGSFVNNNPFSFTDFANLFQEIGIKIEQLEPITKYKEDTVLDIDNVQLIEDKPLSDPILNSFAPNINIENMNVNLDPNIMSDIMSKVVTEMISKQATKREETRPSKDIIKTEHKNV